MAWSRLWARGTWDIQMFTSLGQEGWGQLVGMVTSVDIAAIHEVEVITVVSSHSVDHFSF